MKKQPRHQLTNWFLPVVAALPLHFAAATTLTVTSTNDGGPGSLRLTLVQAASGDTIDFAISGTIVLTSGELLITNNLTLSGPGATNLAISGNNASRVLTI